MTILFAKVAHTHNIRIRLHLFNLTIIAVWKCLSWKIKLLSIILKVCVMYMLICEHFSQGSLKHFKSKHRYFILFPYTPPAPYLHIHFLGIDKYKTVIS